MIPALFLGHTILLALLGTVMVGWLAIKKSIQFESPFPIMWTAITLVIGMLCAGIVSSRFDGQVSASVVIGSSVFVTSFFVILSFASSSFLSHLADRVERKRKLRSWLKVCISGLLTFWLGMMTASINGLVKSTFYVAKLADYKLSDNGHRYVANYRAASETEAANAVQACEQAIRQTARLKTGFTFREREKSWFGLLSREASHYDSFVGSTHWRPLEVTSQFVGSSRGGGMIIRKAIYNSGASGTCTAHAGPISFWPGAVTPAKTVAVQFSSALANIQDNMHNIPINTVPWYAFGANEALSELNLKIFQSEAENRTAEILDAVMFWVSKLLFGYVIIFFATRIRKDLM